MAGKRRVITPADGDMFSSMGKMFTKLICRVNVFLNKFDIQYTILFCLHCGGFYKSLKIRALVSFELSPDPARNRKRKKLMHIRSKSMLRGILFRRLE